jgi:hypothetical protein
MVPVLIIWLIRRFRRSQRINKSAKKLQRIAGVLLPAIILLFALSASSQNRSLNYQILRNGNKVGTLRFSESTTGNMDYLKMESDVKTRFIFTFTAHASEEAVYYKGVLLHSSIYRKLNGNEKVNKQHQADNRQYIIHTGKNSGITKNYPITYNMLSLYSREPENIPDVYSDNFERFVPIAKTAAHTYKVTLPDGNYNYYYYKNGMLTLVEVHHSLYSANIVLTSN